MALTQIQRGFIADGAVTMANLYTSNTGTNTLFLRGDGVWAQAAKSDQDLFTTSSVRFNSVTFPDNTTLTSAIVVLPSGQNGPDRITIGANAGKLTPGQTYPAFQIAVGYQASEFPNVGLNQGIPSQSYSGAVSIGAYNWVNGSQPPPAITWQFNQQLEAISIGMNAGKANQGKRAIAIGSHAGLTDQADRSIAIGDYAFTKNSDSKLSVAIGSNAAVGLESVSIGPATNALSNYSVAIGSEAGGFNTTNLGDGGSVLDYSGDNQIAIGQYAGPKVLGPPLNFRKVGGNGVFIGTSAGRGLDINSGAEVGEYAIAIGAKAGFNQIADNCVILNASGNILDTDNSGFYVSPITESTSSYVLYYNPTTYEITQGAVSAFDPDQGVL